ncbi:hypothetical protein ZIOFF_010086 [Zingiber officinale]|uniref:Zinc finger, CCHC-type n=1 Tax=Zingiber officinale TaxID=94328 RepID=A0A8J5HIB8_ZINOF|nr:hypothetical protein ZIOFF_010086 [Zingiber officinale]
MRDGASVHEHGVKMIGLIEKLLSLDLVIPHELSIDIILLSLPSSFDNFVVNFNMNKLEATLEELFNMLANYEATMKKEKSVFLVGSSSGSKKGPKKKGKKRSAPMKKIKANKKLRPTKPNQSEQPKRSYDLVDYESIDKIDFWVVEETTIGELDYDELEEELDYDELEEELEELPIPLENEGDEAEPKDVNLDLFQHRSVLVDEDDWI